MIICGAVRYYTGCCTISSRAVADGIRELLPQLGDNTKGVMARGIRRELALQGDMGGGIDDMAPWRELLDAIEEEQC